MKYVMFEQTYNNSLVRTDLVRHMPIMFCESLTHSKVAEAIEQISADPIYPVSAGFIDPNTLKTYGVSESMGLSSNPDDMLYFWGGPAMALMEVETVRLYYKQWSKEKR